MAQDLDPIPKSLRVPLENLFIILGLTVLVAVTFAGSMAVIWALHSWPSQRSIGYYELKARVEKLEAVATPARKDE